MTTKELEKLFEPRKLSVLEQTAARAIRRAGFELAQQIARNVPVGPDQSAAIRKVREATMTAIAGIAIGK